MRERILAILDYIIDPNRLLVAALWAFTIIFWMGAYHAYASCQFRFLGHFVEYVVNSWQMFWN